MGKIKKNNEKAITKAITILPRHQQYIQENAINLSKFVQMRIDEEIVKKTNNGKVKK